MILFYVNDLKKEHHLLEEDEYTHCCKVLRKKVNDIILVTDGQGHSAKAKIIEVQKKKALLSTDVIQTHSASSSHITIAIAPPKNRSRWEWFIEKAVEIGADRIIPLRTQNSERVKVNIERSQKIMRSAALQSLRYFHPVIDDITSIDKIINSFSDDTIQKFVAHYDETNKHLKNSEATQNHKIILIGPEGDFTSDELTELSKNNYQQINISENRLRTETAGIVACNLISTMVNLH